MEESDDRLVAEEKVKSRPRKKNLYKQILKQMEFYFGDVNLSKDRFLSQLIAEKKKVPLEVFLSFNKIKTLTTDLQDIVNALSRSDMLKVSKDGLKVSRITPISKKENENGCTIYVEQLPPDATHDWVKDVFSAYGTVDYVSIPKYKNKQAIKGFAFVEYSSPEEAQKALEAFGTAGCLLPSQMLPEELCSIATYEEEEGSKPQKGKKEIKSQQESDEQEVISSSGANVIEDSIEEADETEGSADKKTKKRKRKRIEDLEEEGAAEASEEEENKEKKKKKKDEHLEEDEGDKQKKRKKREIEDEDEGPTEQGEEDPERGGGRGKKKKSTDMDEEEMVEKGEVEQSEQEELEEKNEEEEEEESGKKVKKKKNRKRTQKRKKKEESTSFGLRIMSKVEWLRLRSKYLNLQREKLGALKRMRQEKLDAVKKRMRRLQWGSNYQSPAGENGMQEAAGMQKKSHATPLQFIPGVILQVELPEPVSNAREFQSMVKTNQDIAYVDIEEGLTKMYLRLVSTPASQKLLADRPWEKMTLLKGKEEKQYWDKLFLKRNEVLENAKRKGQDKQAKIRGRNKVLKRAESELGKHITFDDGDE